MSLSVVVLFDFVLFLLLFCLFRLVVVCLFCGGVETHREKKRKTESERDRG